MAKSDPAVRTLMRHRVRVDQIISTFARYGYASWVSAGVPESLRARAEQFSDPALLAMTDGERVQRICFDLGTTFIKIGQLLSTRPDIVGNEVAEALESLQSDVPADSPETVAALFMEEFGKPPEELFAQFSPEPLGSGSIAQVHAATMHDGTDVVVKVQHAGIAEQIVVDLDILAALAAILERNDPDLAMMRPVAVTNEMRRSLLMEVNFGLEAANLLAFDKNFAEEPDVSIPTPYPDLSSQRILTMSRLDGPSLSKAIKELDDAEAFVRRGADIYIEMIFRDGLFHADPHPGNIVVLAGDRVGLLDFGKVGRISEDTQDVIDDMVLSALSEDLDGLIDAILRICDAPPNLDRAALRSDISAFVDQYVRVGAAGLDMTGLSEAANDIMRRHRLFWPSDVSLLMRTLTQLQGLLVQTGADVRVMDLLQPYAGMIAAKKFAPAKMMRRTRRTVRDWDRFLDTFPVEASAILQGVRAGSIDFPLTVDGLDRNVNRVVYAVLAASLFTGSSRLWAAKVPPVVGGMSLPGAVGTVAAGAFAVRLLRSSKRAGGIG